VSTVSSIDAAEARVAGADTREAAATTTVRRAAAAAAFLTAPGFAVAFGAPGGWRDELGFSSGFVPWIVMALLGVAAAVAMVAYRRPVPAGLLALERAPDDPDALRLPPGAGAAALVAVGALVVAATNDKELALMLFGAAPLLAGWAAGRAARVAVSAVAPRMVSAASGIVLTGALLGVLGAAHLGGIAGGSGLDNAAQWTIIYALVSGLYFFLARIALPADRLRVQARLEANAAVVARRGSATGPAEQMPSLAVEGLRVVFGPNTILASTDMEAAAGEVVALVGANGAGKSTLLRAVAGFITPRAGRVLVGGEDVTMLRAEERADAGLAFISGARPIFPDLTVLENLRVAAFRSHLSGRSFAAATDAVCDLVPALATRRREKAGVLSGGEQRLLAVAQAMYRRPRVLLADELSLGLDLDSRISVLDLLRVLADEGVAVVVVDHDLPSLLPRSDRAILLTRGKAEIHTNPVALLDRRSELLPATFLAGAAG
jgi:ABC-type branched-subunit amino acid transport system ATPase component